MASKRKKNGNKPGSGGEKKNPSESARPAIDLSRIKERYSAHPSPGAAEDGGEGQTADGIQFIDAESLTSEELEHELEEQAEADIEGDEIGFSEEALSLFDEEDKPAKRKRKKKGGKRKKKGHTPHEDEDELDFVDLAKPRAREKKQLPEGALERMATFCAVILMIGILLGVYYWLLIERIEVTGNETLERAEVLTTAGINVGEHILLVNAGEAQKKLMANPVVKSAHIRRIYPDKLSIDIVERKPLAAIAGGGSYAIIDGEGFVLSIGPDPGDLLQVYGMGSAGFQRGERLGEADNFNSSILISVIQALEEAGVVEDMTSLDITQPLSVNLQSKDGFTIHVGQADALREKMNNLSLILGRIKAMGYEGGVIDLAVRGDPVYTPQATEAPETEDGDAQQEPEAEPAGTPQTQSTEPDDDVPGPSPSPGQTPAPPRSSGGNNFNG